MVVGVSTSVSESDSVGVGTNVREFVAINERVKLPLTSSVNDALIVNVGVPLTVGVAETLIESVLVSRSVFVFVTSSLLERDTEFSWVGEDVWLGLPDFDGVCDAEDDMDSVSVSVSDCRRVFDFTRENVNDTLVLYDADVVFVNVTVSVVVGSLEVVSDVVIEVVYDRG